MIDNEFLIGIYWHWILENSNISFYNYHHRETHIMAYLLVCPEICLAVTHFDIQGW